MKKKASLKDIAQKLGVSTALVSYVLNNKKEGRIGKEISQKIREVAGQLNYRTNQIAKSLKTNKTLTIGLIVADISNPFFSGLARIIEDEAEKYNYTVIFGSSDENAQKSGKLIDTLVNRQVDGLIIAPSADSESQIIDLQQHEIPFVLIDRYFPAIRTSYVALDNYTAACTATKYMIDQGRKRIGMISYDTELFHLQERNRGYLSALKNARLPGKKKWLREVDIRNNKAEIEKAIHELLYLDPPIDALLFGSNRIAVLGLKYINALPLTVPKDLAIISFDETEALDLFYAPVAYVRQPLQEMGRLATKLLLECIEKNDKITQVNMQAELVVGPPLIQIHKR
jgi:LacI family transcriptional regulator